jgi:hypothetical protein
MRGLSTDPFRLPADVSLARDNGCSRPRTQFRSEGRVTCADTKLASWIVLGRSPVVGSALSSPAMSSVLPTTPRGRRGHGGGGIRQRSGGHCDATIEPGFENGKRKRTFLDGSTCRDVADKLDKGKHNVRRG